MSIGSCWLFGWILTVVIAECMDPNLENVLGSNFGQPIAQIYYDAIGKCGAIDLMTILFIVQFMMGLSILIAASRQSWAFSRDGALPFSSFFRKISIKLGHILFRTVCGCVSLGAVLGLLSLTAPAAAQALFSLAVAAQNVAWGTTTLCRLVWGQKKFVPGPVYTGRFSAPLGWAAIVFLCFGILLSMFPVGGPNPSPADMNYTVVINTAVWLGALAYCFIDARKWFTGPKITLSLEDLSESQERAIIEEGLEVEVVKPVQQGTEGTPIRTEVEASKSDV